VKTAEQRAHPSFDVGHVIDSLVGVYEIQQIVTDWNGDGRIDGSRIGS